MNVFSCGLLPIRQSRQLPKARHIAEARLLQKLDFSDIISEFMKRKVRKNIFSILSSVPNILCFVFMLIVLFS